MTQLSDLWEKLWEKKNPQHFQCLESLETRLGYSFQDRTLLYEALTHKSVLIHDFRILPNNERLEFLGDSCLSLCISSLLWHSLDQTATEGELSKRRSYLVSEAFLASLARSFGLDLCLLVIRAEQNRDSLLANGVESLIGAIFLDGGFSEVHRVVAKLMKEHHFLNALEQDYKSLLQEKVQAKGYFSPIYQDIEEKGPDHKKMFHVAVLVQNRILAKGFGLSKKKASQEAAKNALQFLNSEENETTL